MNRAVAINGSPTMVRGTTATVLAPFIEGMQEGGLEVELAYPSRLRIQPCSCGQMDCWYEHPGECSIKDEMQQLYPVLKEADVLVLATPVYVPLPGRMQDFLNRLMPLVEPLLEVRDGRTRARFRKDVHIRSIALVATGGWWEKGNFNIVVEIAKELALNASVQFAGAVLRPHAFLMKTRGELTDDGRDVLAAVRTAGRELAETGLMSSDTLDRVSRPLISEEALRERYNRLV